MKNKATSLLKRYETIYGVLIGIIPSFLFQIVPSETSVSFSLFLASVTILLIANWFLFASREHAINDLEEAKENLERLTEYQNITLPVININWDELKIMFTCNVDTNLLSKGQCVTIYYKKNEYDYPCGIGHIMDFDMQNRIAQANVLPLNLNEFAANPPPSKENVRISPMIDYEILDAFINENRSDDNE